MLGKLLGAFLGEKIAGRNEGVKGAILGAGTAALAKRGLGPLATAVALGWGAKKLYRWNKERKNRPARYPSDAAGVSSSWGGFS